MQFSDLSLIPPLLQAVTEAGYAQPSPIQQKAIPPVLAGRDLLGCAQTGTGKTAAFALPILQLLAARAAAPAQGGHKSAGGAPRPIRALVLTPTRELALQIFESFETYGRHLPLRAAVIFGGVGQNPQVAQLRRGVDVLVATPGRLNDLIGQGFVKLGSLEIFVLDEADRMLDMGFVNDVKKVLRQLPPKRQTLLFSATMPPEIVQLANGLLHQPAKVFVTPPATTVEKIDQRLYRVDKANKKYLLAQLLKDPAVSSALVFTRTKHGADRVVRELRREGVAAMAIHGNKSQNARQDALARLKDGRMRVLVATDIAARGLDINELSHVFNYELPNVPETYVHRIGRTGRAGHEGIAVSFCDIDETPFLADIEKLVGFKIPEVKDHPWPMRVFEKTDKKMLELQRQERIKEAKAARQAGGAREKQKPPAPAGTPPVPKPGPGAPAPSAAPETAASPAPKRQQAAGGQPRKGRAGEQMAKAPARQQPEKTTGKQPPPARAGGVKGAPRPQEDIYGNRTGGQAIVTKRPVWSDAAPQAEAGGGTPKTEGDDDMARTGRRRGGKNRGGRQGEEQAAPAEPRQPAKKKLDPNAVYDFSETELAEDGSIKILSKDNGEAKYASFEDYLKDH